jgi:uroporphyrinogen decarboxylase
MPIKTPRQLVTDAMYGRKTDRIPCMPFVDNSFAAAIAGMPVSQCFIDPVSHAESLVKTLKRFPGLDGVSINLCLADEIIVERKTENNSHIIKTTGGITWMIPEDDIGSVQSCEITSFDDPRLKTDDPLKAGTIETLKAIPEEICKKYMIICGVTGPFSQVGFLMGLDHLMLATIDDPKGLHKALETRLQFAFDWIDEMAEFDPPAMWIGEGMASSSLISPKTYQEFVLPYEKAVAERMRKVGVPSVLHICGKTTPILDHIPKTTTDCFEIDWQVDMVEAQKRTGDNVCLKGNINTSTLVSAQPEEIYAITTKLIDDAGKDGNLIISSGCAMGRDTPPQNVEAVIQATNDYGAKS